MKENIQIQIYILSRDRPNLLREAIDSALKQNHSLIKFEIIISDNSENDDVYKMVNRNYTQKNIKYIRRSPPLPAKEHFQLVVSELDAKYTVLFHDDDILHPDYVRVMSSFLKNDNIVAVGCNAMILMGDTLSSKKSMSDFSPSIKFNNEKEFLERYLPGSGGSSPFPGYMYRTKYLKQAFLNIPIKGKHSDAAMLSSLLNYGEIVWLEKPLMYYRVHDSNDSVVENISDRLALFHYMKKKGVEKYSTKLLLFRVIFWSRWILQQGGFLSNITHWRYRTVVLSILLKIMKISMTRHFWQIIFLRYKN
jgi:hypothetical protein